MSSSTHSLNTPDPAKAWASTLLNLQSYFHKAIEKLGGQLDSQDEKLQAKAIELVLKYFAKVDRLQARLDELAAQGLAPTRAETEQAALEREMIRISTMDAPEIIDTLCGELTYGPNVDSLFEILLPARPTSGAARPARRGPGRPRKSKG